MKNLTKGMKWWEVLICCLPFVLIIIGGLIGGACGGAGTAINLKLWKKYKSTGVRIALCVGVTVVSFIAYGVLASLFLSVVHY